MKKIIILLLLFPILAFAQHKGHIQGPIYLAKDSKVKMNQLVVNYLTANIYNIMGVDGETIVNVPFEKEYKKNYRIMLIDGMFIQYEWFMNPGTGEWDISIIKPKTKYYEFDFINKSKTEKSKNNDDGMFDTPKDVKEKIKKKDKDKNPLKKAIK